MKPVAESDGAMTTDSEPSMLGTESRAEGGATAPTQNTEQALHEECGNSAASASAACPDTA